MKNNYVKNITKNKLAWLILSKNQLREVNGEERLNDIRLNIFNEKDRDDVEEEFRELAKINCLIWNKNSSDIWSAHDFEFNQIKAMALENIQESVKPFFEKLRKWNTTESRPIDDLIMMFLGRVDLIPTKLELSNNGFLLTNDSIYDGNDYIKSWIADCPSEYARQLWDIPVFEEKTASDHPVKKLYITYPDIFLRYQK